MACRRYPPTPLPALLASPIVTMARISSALLFAAAAVSSASAFTVQTSTSAVSAHHASHLKETVGALSPASPQTFGGRPTGTPLAMADSSEGGEKSNLPMLLDPGTKGGALFLSLVLFIVPIIVYQFGTSALGWDDVEAGRNIGVGFTAVTTVLWVSTYIFRVATKDMTYVSLH